MKAVFASGGAVMGVIGSCSASAGVGCLGAIGMALKSIIDLIFGSLQPPPSPTPLDDPDDYMGSNFWAITRSTAYQVTSSTGAYGFYFPELPTKTTWLDPWRDYPGSLVPIPLVPATMRVRPYFCLVREGVLDSDINKLCANSQMVLPWPMQVASK